MFRYMEKLFWRIFLNRAKGVSDLRVGWKNGKKEEREFSWGGYVKWAKKKRKGTKTLRLSYRILFTRVLMMVYYIGFSFHLFLFDAGIILSSLGSVFTRFLHCVSLKRFNGIVSNLLLVFGLRQFPPFLSMFMSCGWAHWYHHFKRLY